MEQKGVVFRTLEDFKQGERMKEEQCILSIDNKNEGHEKYGDELSSFQSYRLSNQYANVDEIEKRTPPEQLFNFVDNEYKGND
jgi:hypothetical protein